MRRNRRTDQTKTILVIVIVTVSVLLGAALIGVCGYWLSSRLGESGLFGCTVTFECGDTQADFQPEEQTVVIGQMASCPPFPVRDGYVFKGWYSDEACTQKYDFAQPVTQSTVLYAKWVDENSDEALPSEEEIQQFFDAKTEIKAAGASFRNEDGYTDPENVTSELDAVEASVQEQMAEGSITYYGREEQSIYVEFACGIPYVYAPSLEGYDSGGTDMEVLMIEPFGSDELDDDGDTRARFNDNFVNRIRDYNALQENLHITRYQNEQVTRALLKKLPQSDLLIWNGHGGYAQETGSYLVTAEQAPDQENMSKIEAFIWSNSKKYILVSTNSGDDCIAITAKFVESYFPEMDHGLVYLCACQSGTDTRLADAFLSLGADAVVANGGSEGIYTEYNLNMMHAILKRMMGAENGDQTIYNAIEALDIAQNQYDIRSYYIDDNQQVITTDAWVYIVGEQEYAFCSGLKGMVAADGSSEETESLPMEELDLEVVNSSGTVVQTGHAESDGGFRFINLDPGTYELVVHYQEQEVGRLSNLEVQDHRLIDIGAVVLESTELTGRDFVYLTGASEQDGITYLKVQKITLSEDTSFLNMETLVEDIPTYWPKEDQIEVAWNSVQVQLGSGFTFDTLASRQVDNSFMQGLYAVGSAMAGTDVDPIFSGGLQKADDIQRYAEWYYEANQEYPAYEMTTKRNLVKKMEPVMIIPWDESGVLNETMFGY